MSSNSTISQNKAQWTSNTIFSQAVPKAVTTGLGALQSVLQSAETVLNVIKNIVQDLEIFLSSPGELLVTFLKSYSQALITMFQDVLSLGGNYIIIHPYNVVQTDGVTPKYPIDLYDSTKTGVNVQFNPATSRALPVPGIIVATQQSSGKSSYYKHVVPSLTPQQAINEFISSFSNAKDTHKPTWSVNTEAAGMGFIITTGNISAFINLIYSINQFLNFKELNDVVSSYSKKINSGLSDITAQGQTPGLLSSIDFSAFGNITSLQENNFILQSSSYTTSAKLTILDSIIENTDIGGYHWGGLNLYNFPLLQDVCILLQKLVKRIDDSIQSNDQAIQKIAQAIVKKIIGIQSIITEVYQVAVTVGLALEYTGLYTFTIPQGSGGIQYIQQALQSSLSTSPLAPVLNTTQFTILGFFGAGEGINLSSWSSLLQTAYNSTAAELQSILTSLGTTFQYKVDPDFSKQVFSFGQVITLSVSSSNIPSGHPYYYIYVMKDNNNNIISQQTETNITAGDIALINTSKFTINLNNSSGLTETVNYSVSITVFDGLLYSNTYNTTFPVSNAVSGLNTKLTSNSKGSVTLNDNTIISLISGNKVIEQQYGGPGTILSFGANAQSGQSLTLNINGTNGNLIVPIDNHTGYLTYDFDTFADLIATTYLRVEALPIMICINFEGIVEWGVSGSSMPIINLPMCTKITEATTYEYIYYDTNNVQYGPYYLVVSVVPASSLSIC